MDGMKEDVEHLEAKSGGRAKVLRTDSVAVPLPKEGWGLERGCAGLIGYLSLLPSREGGGTQPSKSLFPRDHPHSVAYPRAREELAPFQLPRYYPHTLSKLFFISLL